MANIAYGLDISDRSVEVVRLAIKNGGYRVTGFGKGELPPGVVTQGAIVDADLLVSTLARVLDDAFGKKRGHIKIAVFLPELQVYSKTFVLPATLTRELAEKAVALEAADSFPINLQHAVTALEILGRTQESQDIFYAAVDREVARGYVDMLHRLQLEPLFFGMESLSVARGLLPASQTEPVLIVDMGSRTTMFAVHDRGAVRMSGNVMFGGDSLSVAIERQLGMPLSQADELRRTAGFNPAAEEGRLLLIMGNPMNQMIGEIKRTIAYYAQISGRKIGSVILAGGTSLMPNLPEYIAADLPDLTVTLGDPLRKVSLDKMPPQKAKEFAKEAVLWSGAIGLTLRALGARGSPGVNLMPGTQKATGGGLKGFFQGIKNSLTQPIGMSPGQKKPAPKKKAAAPRPEITATPAPIAPIVESGALAAESNTLLGTAARDVSVGDATGDAGAAPDVAPSGGAGVGVRSMLPSTSAVSESKPEEKDEKDFGGGIGDLLGNDSAKTPSAGADVFGVGAGAAKGPTVGAGSGAVGGSGAAAGFSMGTMDSGSKRSLESILTKPMPKSRAYEEEAVPRKSKLLPLLGGVLLLIVIAAGGIYMFVAKNGIPAMPSFLAGYFGGAANPASQGGAPVATSPADGIPATVSTVVDLSAAPAAAPVTTPGTPAATPPATAPADATAPASAPAADARPALVSRTVETDVKATQTFPATGEATSTAGSKSVGRVTITNTASQAFNFVATTRLMSKEGVLFRMVSAATIPTGGSVTVDVRADQSGPAGDIGPSTFTIPGLSAALQTQVTGKSDVAMSGGGGKTKAITAADLAAAKAALTEKLRTDGDANLKAALSDGELLLPDLVTSTEVSTDAPVVGTAGAEFSMTLTLRFHALVWPEKAALPLLQTALTAAVPAGSVAAYALGTPLYTVQAYDTATDRAQVRMEAPVTVK